jgi:hypothetical protein
MGIVENVPFLAMNPLVTGLSPFVGERWVCPTMASTAVMAITK